ncbi:response regulator [Paraburkholderia bengalensis]|uniref:Response regulator n=1 Tax=Paraburkholderia bengalensis TaxID=2747562 RepID=A0ABU8J697_9BURK
MKTILLVDDDSGLLRAWERLLVAQGFEVRTASDGITGYATAVRVTPALVVTDQNMPNMGGVDLCDRLRASAGLSSPVPTPNRNRSRLRGTSSGKSPSWAQRCSRRYIACSMYE